MPSWSVVAKEIDKATRDGDEHAFDTVRRKYLHELHKHTGRNVIAYYSGFLTKPGVQGVDINDEDKNGFMSLLSQENQINIP